MNMTPMDGSWQKQAAFEAAINSARDLRALVHKLGAAVVLVSDGIEDEGDRCHLESANHANVLLEAKQLYDEYRLETGDNGSEDALSENRK